MRAVQQDPLGVEERIDLDYPKIKKLARKEKADIYFEDVAWIPRSFLTQQSSAHQTKHISCSQFVDILESRIIMWVLSQN